MQRSKFISWASTSLSGHVALFEIVFGIPIAVLMIFLNYMEGTLTIGWAMWIVGSCAAISIILAIAIWTTLTLHASGVSEHHFGETLDRQIACLNAVVDDRQQRVAKRQTAAEPESTVQSMGHPSPPGQMRKYMGFKIDAENPPFRKQYEPREISKKTP
jgi:hypothetical protein